MGGHIAGLTGKRVSRGRLQSVVAMDPAGPLFSMRSPTERVAHTDAVYVESIYTDQGGLGFDEPLGHANFYPNWGKYLTRSTEVHSVKNCHFYRFQTTGMWS